MVAKSKYKTPDSDDEDTHFLVNVRIRSEISSTLLAAGKRVTFKDDEIILDTGTNGSIFRNVSLLDSIHKENRVTFDALDQYSRRHASTVQGALPRGRHRQHPLVLPTPTDGSLQRESPTRGRQLRYLHSADAKSLKP